MASSWSRANAAAVAKPALVEWRVPNDTSLVSVASTASRDHAVGERLDRAAPRPSRRPPRRSSKTTRSGVEREDAVAGWMLRGQARRLLRIELHEQEPAPIVQHRDVRVMLLELPPVLHDDVELLFA